MKLNKRVVIKKNHALRWRMAMISQGLTYQMVADKARFSLRTTSNAIAIGIATPEVKAKIDEVLLGLKEKHHESVH